MRSLLAVTAAVLLVGSGCTGDEPEASPTPASDATPIGPPLDAMDWQSPDHSGELRELVRAGRGFLGVEARAVARLGPEGEDVWRYESRESDDFDGFVVDGVPVAAPVADPEDERTYRPHLVHGLDPRTGEVRWTREATSAYTFSDGEHVVVPTCTGEKTGALGDCTLTAYDPRTGTAVWSRPTWAGVELAQSGDGYVVLQTFPTSSSPRYVVLQPDGTVRATIDLPEDGGILSPAGDVLVTDGPFDQPAPDGCGRGVTAWSTDGQVLWRRGLPEDQEDPGTCAEASAIPVDDGVAVLSDQVPLLLDPATGRTTWQGTVPGSTVYAASEGVVLDDQTRGEQTGDPRTVAYDSATGDELWSYAGAIGVWETWQGYATTSYPCQRSDDGRCTVVVDLHTGEVLTRVPGAPSSFVPAADGGDRPGLLTTISDGPVATYGYVTLPAL